MKVLIISNNLMSKNNNNGKVLWNYFSCFNNDEICQFYISGEKDDDLKFDRFCITDNDALKSCFKFGIGSNSKQTESEKVTVSVKKTKKSPLKTILRYFVWNAGFWKSRNFKQWIKKQQFTHVFLMLGDNPYLIKLSYKLAKKYHAKLLIQVGEDYPLKKYNYLSGNLKSSLIYRLFHSILKSKFKKAVRISSCILFNSEFIKDDYLRLFKIKNYCILPHGSSFVKRSCASKEKNFVYAGNLGLGRIRALKQFANMLFSLYPDKNIDVYSNYAQVDIGELSSLSNVRLHDYVTNECLENIINSCFALLHIEYNNPYNKIDLRNAFSTKIADMICSGKRIALFSPPDLAESKFFIKYLPNNYASDTNELSRLITYIYSENYSFAEQENISSSFLSENISLSLKKIISE